MIIDYDKNPLLGTDEKLMSLIASIQRSLDDVENKIDAINKEIKKLKEEN